MTGLGFGTGLGRTFAGRDFDADVPDLGGGELLLVGIGGGFWRPDAGLDGVLRDGGIAGVCFLGLGFAVSEGVLRDSMKAFFFFASFESTASKLWLIRTTSKDASERRNIAKNRGSTLRI